MPDSARVQVTTNITFLSKNKSVTFVNQLPTMNNINGISYRKSTKVDDDAEAPISCSEDKTEKAQKEFQECSHSAVTSFYENMENITEKKGITSKLCSTLNTIGSVCISHLSECFAQEDVKQMRKSHMKEIRSFLRRITRDKLNAEDIKECEVIEVDEEEKVTTDNSETLINDEKGSGKDNQSKKYSSNHTKLMSDVLDKEENTDFNEEIINQTSENQNSSVQEDENDNGNRLQDYSENTNAKAETFNSVTLHEKLTKEDIMLNTDAKENETLTLKDLSKNTAKKENCKYLILLLILILVMR